MISRYTQDTILDIYIPMFCGRNRDINITQVNFSWERSHDTLETETRESTPAAFKLAIGFTPQCNVFLCSGLTELPSSFFIQPHSREVRKLLTFIVIDKEDQALYKPLHKAKRGEN